MKTNPTNFNYEYKSSNLSYISMNSIPAYQSGIHLHHLLQSQDVVAACNGSYWNPETHDCQIKLDKVYKVTKFTFCNTQFLVCFLI